ncbi:HDR152Cp [Eremothecium sinecaudum]|uniref:RNA helicase n=1 Tax=Eremothecium sinecaudum TaxID=45286 RepID=A0A0X8HSY6_9SACH|nr:HDR152Cp [Eremothecium sinecaudum]AMD20894.1 HDR152Cp [Eremothecium sinecaudum]
MKVHPFNKRISPKVVRLEDNEKSYDDSDDEHDQQYVSKAALNAKAKSLLSVRETLPVYQNSDVILEHIRGNKVTILIGETGSGKSTQIPQLLLQEATRGGIKGAIAVTQPRRVAAINLATRVAEEYGCNVGSTVGYSVRFDNRTHATKTKLKYLTDGMLLRELMLDRKLKEYKVVMIDEAHERTILTDLILGFLKHLLLTTRPDLKVVVMSATLQAEKFSHFFENAPILFVEGRKFPVETFYVSQACDDIVDATVRCCVQLNSGEQLGDILCFLPGQEEIDKVVDILNKVSDHLGAGVPRLVALPLYAALPPAAQTKVFEPVSGFRRKIIVSTNIAETSVTIAGVKYVVDSGLRKCKVWRHQLGLSTLLTVPISKASAAQRSGRAGRESAGKCFRIYTEQDYGRLPDQSEPEIARCDVTAPLLMLKQLGVADLVNWKWLEHPGRDAIVQALQELYMLGALDDAGNITSDGRTMALLPLAPHLSRVLIEAHKNGCLSPVLDIISCLSVENLMLNPPPELRDDINARRLAQCPRGSYYGDLIMLKELYDLYVQLSSPHDRKHWCAQMAISARGFRSVIKVRAQLQGYVNSLKWHAQTTSIPLPADKAEIANILKSFLTGFPKNTAIGMPDRSYRTTLHGETISIHPSSLLFSASYSVSPIKELPSSRAPAILYTEYVFTVKGYARCVSRLELEWLQQLRPTALSKQAL